MRAVFGPDAEGRARPPARAAARADRGDQRAARLVGPAGAFGPRWLVRSRGYREAMAPVEAAAAGGGATGAGATGEGSRAGHRLDPGRGPLRGRLAAERAGPARRTDDPAHRRPDLELAGLGLRAAAAPPGEAGAAAGGGARRRGRAPTSTRWSRRRCGCARRCRSSSAACCEPMRAGRLRPARRAPSVAPCVHLIHRNEEIYPDAAQLPARALPRARARHLHLDPLRRRRPPLPRRQLRRTGDEAGAAHGAERGRAARRSTSRAERVRKSAISFSPDQQRPASSPSRVTPEPARRRHWPSAMAAESRPARRRRRRQGRRRSRPRSTSSTASASGRSR